MVASIIRLFSHDARVLIDPGSTHSFIMEYFARHADCLPSTLDFGLAICTPLGKTMSVEFIFKSCIIEIDDVELLADLVVLDIRDFDVILGMDWLANHHAKMDCFSKEVTFSIPSQFDLVFKGTRRCPKIISAIKAKRLMRNGGIEYLTYAIEIKEAVELKIENIAMVRKFREVFPDDLPGLLLDRDIEFVIELVEGTQPISMAPLELKEIKAQLQELLDRGFICLSVSLWGAPVLFVKKNDGTMRMCINYR